MIGNSTGAPIQDLESASTGSINNSIGDKSNNGDPTDNTDEGSSTTDIDDGSGTEDTDEGSSTEDTDEGSSTEDTDEGSSTEDTDEGSSTEDTAALNAHIVVNPESVLNQISPYIYGVNFGSDAQHAELNFPVRRWGGNHTSRYSWEDDVSNRASDWFFLNLPEANADPAALPHGSAADRFIDGTRQFGGTALLTVPTIGWTPLDRTPRWGFSISKYGNQEQSECSATGFPSWCHPDAGNGLLSNGEPIADNDPSDTSRPIGKDFVTRWLEHIRSRVGNAGNGGLKFVALDNEPILWSETHRDVHPEPVTYDELWDRTQTYAAAIKAADPDIKIFGPAVWGWCAYFGSAGECGGGPDQQAHGGLPLLAWYLEKNCAYEAATGVRLIDYLDIHFYPAAPGVMMSSDESAATSALRLRSLRGLYDETYVDESWIGQPVNLIPRMRGWIDAYCPGTKLAISEYNFGKDHGASSALAQAESLAIFGREGVDLATRWLAPAEGSFVEDAFRMYLDYDGKGGSIVGDSLFVESNAADEVKSYAVRHSDGTLFVLLFNHDTGEKVRDVGLLGYGDASATLYGFDAQSRFSWLGERQVSNGVLGLSLPARSATLVIVAP